METHIPTLSELFLQQALFIRRPDVRYQWIAIFSSLMMGWFLSKLFWHWLQQKFPHFTTFSQEDQRLNWQEYRAFLIQSLDFPLLGFFLLGLTRFLFLALEWTDGLIIRAFRLMIVYVIYRLV
ncbi:MAG: mechanosensitive ion channel protein, partial [Microcystaceae cyanobacterium]